jgi:hypothetical protein
MVASSLGSPSTFSFPSLSFNSHSFTMRLAALFYITFLSAVQGLPILYSQTESERPRLLVRDDSSNTTMSNTTTIAPGNSTAILNSTAPSAPPQSDGQKFVVAHHMVGNTYPYTIDDWKTDISMASANGIDGFALNVGMCVSKLQQPPG